MKKIATLLATGCTGLFLLTGCSAAASTTAAPAATQTPGQTGGTGQRGQRNQVNGTFGIIADISGNTLQVQGTNEQTAVTHTDTTTFTRQQAGTTADLVAGACVTVRGTGQSAEAADAAVPAASITVTPAENGECMGFGGFGGGGGRPMGGDASGRPEGRPSNVPTPPAGEQPGAMPSGMPSGAPGAGRGSFVSGTVTSLADGTLIVAAHQNPGGNSSGTGETTERKVTLSDTTTISTTVPGSAADLKVGLCALATGKPDNTGAVTATSIRLSDAVDGACSMR